MAHGDSKHYACETNQRICCITGSTEGRLQEERDERERKPKPKPPSGPDRWFIVILHMVEAPPKNLPQMTFGFKQWDEARRSLSMEWNGSAEATSSIGLMDLSAEMRMMVYKEVCSKLKREGVEWRKTAPQVTGDNEGEESAFARIPSGRADCAITLLWRNDGQRP
ncbi:hypothetical protein BDU57DRAFT_525799 [Ampelomyces quisqualis]|uniref:Uncharacterized protein n=1 Tax=Ampelomyces quisqualis TaxID=50730 RepID=A0A6A5R4C3_AMPQU|nr:hypothetical protein BDU57DRAFT_525799 [Ampelomyces quisqualis]